MFSGIEGGPSARTLIKPGVMVVHSLRDRTGEYSSGSSAATVLVGSSQSDTGAFGASAQQGGHDIDVLASWSFRVAGADERGLAARHGHLVKCRRVTAHGYGTIV